MNQLLSCEYLYMHIIAIIAFQLFVAYGIMEFCQQ